MAVVLAGILNLTPDSFSDGGRFSTVDQAVETGLEMARSGADWIDVGGESTRPGSVPVSEQEETERIIPVIAQLRRKLADRVRISVDTYKAGTARSAIAAGATIVNDVSGATLDPGILEVVAQAQATIVLGHLRGQPASMMTGIRFSDVVEEVAAELALRIAAARAAGCREIWADPGIGFGKDCTHNLRLLGNLPALCTRVGVPLMLGVSRKRFLGDLTGKPAQGRTFATAAAVAAAVLGGAAAVRVHDVAEMRDVVRVAQAILGERGFAPSEKSTKLSPLL